MRQCKSIGEHFRRGNGPGWARCSSRWRCAGSAPRCRRRNDAALIRRTRPAAAKGACGAAWLGAACMRTCAQIAQEPP